MKQSEWTEVKGTKVQEKPKTTSSAGTDTRTLPGPV